jgi:hypothetical protein
LLDARDDAMHHQQARVDAGERMPLAVPALGLELSAKRYDLRIRTPPFEPSLPATPLHAPSAF